MAHNHDGWPAVYSVHKVLITFRRTARYVDVTPMRARSRLWYRTVATVTCTRRAASSIDEEIEYSRGSRGRSAAST